MTTQDTSFTKEQVDDVLDVVADFMEETLGVLDVDPETVLDLRFAGDRIVGDLDGDRDDIALIIGKRGQTLDAIQYLANAVVGVALDTSIPVEIDAQGYRERRAQQLEKMATRAVSEVARHGDQVELEAMTASERKVVHMFLKDHPDVETSSAGREPNRRVTVFPRKDG